MATVHHLPARRPGTAQSVAPASYGGLVELLDFLAVVGFVLLFWVLQGLAVE